MKIKSALYGILAALLAAPFAGLAAADGYAKSGVPLAEQTWPMPPWGAEKDGLSAGLRVIGDARLSGEVRVELWVRNSSAKDVKFSQCLRADVGLSVVAKDKDGKDHSADITLFLGKPGFSHLLLPSGHGVKVKDFSVKFGAGKNDKLESGWVNLQLTPGDYKLRAVWSDTTSRGAAEGEWTGKLTTGEVDLKRAARHQHRAQLRRKANGRRCGRVERGARNSWRTARQSQRPVAHRMRNPRTSSRGAQRRTGCARDCSWRPASLWADNCQRGWCCAIFPARKRNLNCLFL